MNIVFAKAKWEAWNDPLEPFLARAAADGFTATEIYLPSLSETPSEVAAAHRRHGLSLVAQFTTLGDTPAQHLRHLDDWFERALNYSPVAIDCHTGADWFSFEDNLRIFRRALELEKQGGIPFCHELHRGRALFNANDTLRYIRELPELQFTADFSHWQVVHESDRLERQTEAVAAVIARSRHIHARVGFGEGPQVSHPAAPEWSTQLEACLGWWRAIVAARRADATPLLTITPEFGPVPYMPVIPFENRPVADAWEVNHWMKDYLNTHLARA